MIAFWAFLRAVPSWAWLGLGLLGAGLLYGHLRYNAGQADIQAKWDSEKAAFTIRMAEAEAQVAGKTQAVNAAYDAGVASAAQMKEREISDAYQRGKAAGERIRAGAVSVRTVWRDRDCPAATEGPGSGSGAGPAQVSGERAEAIGSLLAAAGADDATYAEAYRRLESAQKLLNACFDGVPVAEQ